MAKDIFNIKSLILNESQALIIFMDIMDKTLYESQKNSIDFNALYFIYSDKKKTNE